MWCNDVLFKADFNVLYFSSGKKIEIRQKFHFSFLLSVGSMKNFSPRSICLLCFESAIVSSWYNKTLMNDLHVFLRPRTDFRNIPRRKIIKGKLLKFTSSNKILNMSLDEETRNIVIYFNGSNDH